MKRRLLLLALALVGAGASCHPRPPHSAPAPSAAVTANQNPAKVDASTVEPTPVAESSVKPGANKEFLKPDLDVAQWEQRFERGGRDIYDHRAQLLAIAGVRPGMSVADVGAGTGLFTMLFADAVGPGGRVYAEDISRKFVDHIAERVRQEKRTNVVPVLGTDRSIELPAGSVDLVFLCDVYHHFEYPRSMLASIARALRPGGHLMVVDFVREKGTSAAWILDHVRAGEATFVAEIQEAGFQPVARHTVLKENYVRSFRKPVQSER